jgi:hypothetical protein
MRKDTPPRAKWQPQTSTTILLMRFRPSLLSLVLLSLVVVAAACSATTDRDPIDATTTAPTAPAAPQPAGPIPVPLPNTDVAFSPIASSQSPSGNLAERPISGGGPFGAPTSFAADPSSVRVDLAVVNDELYISVGTPQDASLIRTTLNGDQIEFGDPVTWPTDGNDPIFGVSDTGVGLVNLPGRTAQTGAVTFKDGWAWVAGEFVAIGTPDNYSETPLDLLDDTLLVSNNDVVVALTNPVRRLNHGIVGDGIEGGGFAVINDDGTVRAQVVLDAPDVIEGRSAMLGDVTGNGQTEVVVTLSNAEVGAWIAVYDLDGTMVARSTAIGLGNRWRHQFAIVPTTDGPAILNVVTPHIGGTLEALRFVEGRLEPVATIGQYSTHTINSRILDGAYIGDLDGDGELEALVPNQPRNRLVALSLRDGKFVEKFILETPDKSRSESNTAVIDWQGRTVVAVVSIDGVVTLWMTNL